MNGIKEYMLIEIIQTVGVVLFTLFSLWFIVTINIKEHEATEKKKEKQKSTKV